MGSGISFSETGDGAVSDAAGVDELEVTQVSGDVEREAVGCDAARDVNADCADFSSLVGVCKTAPDSGETGDTSGVHTVDATEADESLFDHADKVNGTEAARVRVLKSAQVEDRVADELAGAVVCDVAAAIDFMQSDAPAGEKLIGCQDVGALGVAAEGEYRRVFEQEENVVDATLQSELGDLRLKTEALVISDTTEKEVLNHGHFYCRSKGQTARLTGNESSP